MSRVPRSLEHLKTGVTAEATAAAHFRAFAARAEREGHPNLAGRWRELAAEKDALAVLQLEASGRVGDDSTNLRAALADERFENDVLYPKLIRSVEGEIAEVFQQVVAAQQATVATLEELRDAVQASTGDIE